MDLRAALAHYSGMTQHDVPQAAPTAVEPSYPLSDAPDRPAWPAIRKGMRGRCPRCGEGRLYRRYLKLVDRCAACGEDLRHARADDGPAYLSILVTAKISGTAMLAVYEAFQPSPWVMAGVFSVLVVAMALALLPVFKGLIVGVQWAKRMHGF